MHFKAGTHKWWRFRPALYHYVFSLNRHTFISLCSGTGFLRRDRSPLASAKSANMTTGCILPAELIYQILCYMSPGDVVRLRAVCSVSCCLDREFQSQTTDSRLFHCRFRSYSAPSVAILDYGRLFMRIQILFDRPGRLRMPHLSVRSCSRPDWRSCGRRSPYEQGRELTYILMELPCVL